MIATESYTLVVLQHSWEPLHCMNIVNMGTIIVQLLDLIMEMAWQEKVNCPIPWQGFSFQLALTSLKTKLPEFSM